MKYFSLQQPDEELSNAKSKWIAFFLSVHSNRDDSFSLVIKLSTLHADET